MAKLNEVAKAENLVLADKADEAIISLSGGDMRKVLTTDAADTIRLDSTSSTGPEAALACAHTVARVTAFTASGRICQQPYGDDKGAGTCKVFP